MSRFSFLLTARWLKWARRLNHGAFALHCIMPSLAMVLHSAKRGLSEFRFICLWLFELNLLRQVADRSVAVDRSAQQYASVFISPIGEPCGTSFAPRIASRALIDVWRLPYQAHGWLCGCQYSIDPQSACQWMSDGIVSGLAVCPIIQRSESVPILRRRAQIIAAVSGHSQSAARFKTPPSRNLRNALKAFRSLNFFN